MDAQPTQDPRWHHKRITNTSQTLLESYHTRKATNAKRAGDADPRLSHLKEEKKKYPPAALTLIDYHNVSYLTQRTAYDCPTQC
jgi:hypothetical protein